MQKESVGETGWGSDSTRWYNDIYLRKVFSWVYKEIRLSTKFWEEKLLLIQKAVVLSESVFFT